jgi:hypothetical protein
MVIDLLEAAVRRRIFRLSRSDSVELVLLLSTPVARVFLGSVVQETLLIYPGRAYAILESIVSTRSCRRLIDEAVWRGQKACLQCLCLLTRR